MFLSPDFKCESSKRKEGNSMRAARMHDYNQPLVLEDVPIPDIKPDEVLLKVTAAGMCRTDVQLLDGYFRKYAQASFPVTPGHEIVGEVEKIGSVVSKTVGLLEGDQAVVGEKRGHSEFSG